MVEKGGFKSFLGQNMSFVSYGMECLMQKAIESGKYDSFVASSGGNAGIAASYRVVF